MDKQQTINIINSNVKQNGREEITGPVLNNVLLAMVEYSSEVVPVQDLGPIEEELDDHERRITSNTRDITLQGGYIAGLAEDIRGLRYYAQNLTENDIKMAGSYPELGNPNYQSSFNRRIFDYVMSGSMNQNALAKDQLNTVTSNFGITNPNWSLREINGNPVIDVKGHRTTFQGALGFSTSLNSKIELAPGYMRGMLSGITWSVTKRSTDTATSDVYLPTTESTRTLALSVNGNFADASGNITLSSLDPYRLPTATTNTLGGVMIGTGLTIDNNGLLSATPLSYELPTATSTVKGGIRIGNGLTSNIQGVTSLLPATPFMIGGVRPDNSTITVDENGTLTVIGGGSGGGYVLPTATTTRLGGIIVGSGLTVNASGVLSATGSGGGSFNPSGVNTVTNAFTLKAPNWELKNYQYGGAELNLGASSGVLFTDDNGIDYYNEEGQLVVSPAGFYAESFTDNNSIGITPIAITVSEVEYSFPRNTTNRTLPISVNGNYADANGNITVASGGATYTGSNGINISGSNVITPTYGTTSNTVAQGNDSRFPTTAEKTAWNNKLDKPTANAELASVVGFDAGGVSKKSEVVEIASSWTSGTAPTATQLTDAFPNAMFVLAVNLTVPKMYIKSGGGWKSVNLETVV